MAYEGAKDILPGTHLADADLSSKQFYAVKATNTAGGGVALAGAGEFALGILQNNPAQYKQCEIAFQGVSKCIAGAAFNRGALLASDANGKLVTAAAGDYIVGVALETAGAENNIVTVLLKQARLEA